MGHTSRNWGILGIISHAGGHPLIKWLPLCVPPALPLMSYLLTGANCKQKLVVVWSGVVMIPALSHAPASPPLPILSVVANGFQMFPSCAQTLTNIRQTSEKRLNVEAFNMSTNSRRASKLRLSIVAKFHSIFKKELLTVKYSKSWVSQVKGQLTSFSELSTTS